MAHSPVPASIKDEVAVNALNELQHSHDVTRMSSRVVDAHEEGGRGDVEDGDARKQSRGGRKTEIELTDQTNLLPFKKILAVFSGLALCALVSCLDSTIVATALPTISAAFNAGSVVSWVPSAYLLTSTAFQPLCMYSDLPLCTHN